VPSVSHLGAATAAVTNRFVASANMKVGAYTVANAAPAVPGGRHVTVTHTQVGGVTDTLGTIVVVGRDLSGNVITETITPLDGTVATSTKVFISVTSVTGVGWVIDTTADTIVVGHDAASIVAVGGGTLYAVNVNTTAASTITIADSSGTLAVMAASIAVGDYVFNIPWSGYLSFTVAGASDITISHSPTIPTTYALV
jgi:hypothetical protein